MPTWCLFSRLCSPGKRSENRKSCIPLCSWAVSDTGTRMKQTGDRETVEYGPESAAKDCRGGMWDVRYSSSTQTGQRRISTGADTGSDWKKRRKDINKQTG